MCDYFDMACHDTSSALRLNIKVNSENLLPNEEKYNVGSLRLPPDPSWPKIPQRRLADDLEGVIEPPCVVTLTGTPRKSRTTVRTSHCQQFSKNQVPAPIQHIYHKVSPTTHPLKRRPGCTDPRFKRVTTVKSQVTSIDPPDRENRTDLSRSAVIIPNQTQYANENVRKTVPEKDTDPPKIRQQEAEKPGEIRGIDSIGVQTMPIEKSLRIDDLINHTINAEVCKEYPDTKTILDNKTEMEHHKLSPRGIVDSKAIKQSSTDEKKPVTDSKGCERHDNDKLKVDCSNTKGYPVSNLTIVPNTPASVQSKSSRLPYCPGNASQFFLVVENKVQAPSPNALQGDISPEPPGQYTTQCYNVQVPVLTYQNLPLQISTQTSQKGDIPSQLSLSPVLTIPSTTPLENSADPPFDNSSGNLSLISEVPDANLKAGHSVPQPSAEKIKETVSNSAAPEKSASESPKVQVDLDNSKNNCSLIQSQEKNSEHLISSAASAQQARKTLGTPPIKLDREYNDNHKFEDLRVQQFLSDTTDSELYSIGAKQTTFSNDCLYSKETSCSGSDCELHFHNQSKFKDILQLKKNRRTPICSPAAPSHGGPFKEENLQSSMDDQEPIRKREDSKQKVKTQRKMKSEQNLPRYLPFGGKKYKNTSDPHLTVRESYKEEKEEKLYPSSCSNARRKRDNRYRETVAEKSNSEEVTDRTTDVDSDAVNLPAFCDTHRTDLSNNEEASKPRDNTQPGKPTSLPAKTQQLLNKSYMEYYDKLQSRNINEKKTAQQRYARQTAVGAPQLKKRRAESHPRVTKINERNEAAPDDLALEKFSALSNIINKNLKTALKNSRDTMQTRHLYVNENMKSSSDPTAGTESAVPRRLAAGESADLYDSSVPSSALTDRMKRKREKPAEKSLLKLKTIVFFGLMMYAMIVLLPLIYNFFLYDEYEDYEDLSYIELTLEYIVSSFRDAFGGIFDAINDLLFRPVRLE